MMRAVLDTNVVVSALIWGGKPFALIQAAIDGDVLLYSSPALREELRGVLARNHLAARLQRRQFSVEQAAAFYNGLTEIIDPQPIHARVSRDLDDDAVLALAVAAQWTLSSPATPTCLCSAPTLVSRSSVRHRRSQCSKPGWGSLHRPSAIRARVTANRD
jgi:putative PIN family toxin of toxin-antitoxin system